VLAWDGQRYLHSAAYCVRVLDTTGAGDLFHAGFIYGLLRDWPLERTLDFSCAAAAINCMAQGARGGIRQVDAIEKLMATVARYQAEDGLPSIHSWRGKTRSLSSTHAPPEHLK
jgi:sugar/nucleoside kinase (ribokinase family)